MEFDDIRAFVAVAEARSISRVALDRALVERLGGSAARRRRGAPDGVSAGRPTRY